MRSHALDVDMWGCRRCCAHYRKCVRKQALTQTVDGSALWVFLTRYGPDVYIVRHTWFQISEVILVPVEKKEMLGYNSGTHRQVNHTVNNLK